LALSGNCFAEAAGSHFGSLTTARTLGMGHGAFGLGVGLADRTSFVGSFNYGLSKFTEGRVKLGLVDVDYGGDSEIKLSLAADFKYQFMVMDKVSNSPLDMATGAFLEFIDFDGASMLQVGGHLIGSYPVLLSNGKLLSPYGRLNIRMERYSNGGSDSEMEFGLNGGVAFEMTKTINIYGEFQIDGNDGIFLGIDFRTM
jgi:hypothetical protein